MPTTRLLVTPESSWSQNLHPSGLLQTWRRSTTGSNGPQPMIPSSAQSKFSSQRPSEPSLASRRLLKILLMGSKKSTLPLALMGLMLSSRSCSICRSCHCCTLLQASQRSKCFSPALRRQVMRSPPTSKECCFL